MAMNQPSTVLVTGATGNVGRPLVEQLLAAGHRVRALTRTPATANLPRGAEVVSGDLADVGSLAGVFTGVDAAHLITVNGSDHSELATGREIVDLAGGAGVRRVTVLAGGPEPSELETAVRASDLAWTRLSPVEFMANALEWAESVRTEGVVREAFPEMRSAMVHEADIAAVAVVALTGDDPGRRDHWITGPQALTPADKVATIADVLGRDVRYVELTRDEIVANWRAEGYGDEDVEFFIAMRTDPPVAGYTVLPTVEQVTGRPPRTFARWVQDNRAAFGG